MINKNNMVLGIAPRIVMYSHDGFGLGHLRRNFNIARELVSIIPNSNVLLITSSPDGMPYTLPPRIDYVRLPSIVKIGHDQWRSRFFDIDIDETVKIRSQIIKSVVQEFAPDLFLVDFMPTGVGNELLPALELIRRKYPATKTVFGIRDFIDDPERLLRRWSRNGSYHALKTYFDQVFVYGDHEIFDSIRVYGFDRPELPPACYTGYVVSPVSNHESGAYKPDSPGNDLVMIVGGGADAFPIIKAVVEGLKFLGADCPETAIACGPLMSDEDHRDLQSISENLPIKLLTGFVQYDRLMRESKAIITMGGYNSVIEAVCHEKPMLIIPRQGPSQEQKLRAEKFANLGFCSQICLADATPDKLATIIRLLPKQHRNKQIVLPTDGAKRVVAETIKLLSANSVYRLSSNSVYRQNWTENVRYMREPIAVRS